MANALNKCGFKGKRKKKVSEEKLIEEMINLSKEKNKIPSAYDMKNDGKYTRRTYQKRFGSWNNALEECGFEQFRTFGPPEGENHWYWKGGITSHEYGKSWNKKRNKTLERDDYVCRVCGSENGDISPHVHHIVPRRYWDIHTEEKIMNSLNNLISLCGSCHGQLEGKFKGRNHEEFEESAKDYLDIEEIEEKKGIFDY